MTPKRRSPNAWPFERKFPLWLTDHGLSLNAFAERHGFAQSTLQAWVKQGVKMPAEALWRIAKATRLPADYWLDDTIPYPTPVEYEGLAEDLARSLQAVPIADLREIAALVRDPEDRRRTFALRRASQSS